MPRAIVQFTANADGCTLEGFAQNSSIAARTARAAPSLGRVVALLSK